MTQQGLWRSREVPDKPWKAIAMDFFGPLPTTPSQKKYILVFIDLATRWVELIPTEAADASTVADALFLLMSRHGCPQELFSDRGSHFRNKVIQNISTKCQIKQLFSLPLHPEGNGIVERVMRSLKRSLAVNIQEFGASWEEEVSAVEMNLRMTPHTSLGTTPFFLMYGRDPRLPLDVAHQLAETSEGRVLKRFEKIRNDTILRLQRQLHRKNKERFNSSFEVDELVFQILPKYRENKFSTQWRGPLRVIKRVDNILNGYLLRDIYTGREREAHTSSMLRFPWITLEDSMPTTIHDAFFNAWKNDSLAEDRYEIEAIQDHCVVRVGRKYLYEFRVSWYGYDEETWESEENLNLNIPETLEAYKKSNNLPEEARKYTKKLEAIAVQVEPEEEE